MQQGRGVEGMRAPCPLWAVKEISVPDLGQQGALPHVGPAHVSATAASFSVRAWFSWRVCLREHGRTGICLFVHTLVCVYMLQVVCKHMYIGLGKMCVLRAGSDLRGYGAPYSA